MWEYIRDDHYFSRRAADTDTTADTKNRVPVSVVLIVRNYPRSALQCYLLNKPKISDIVMNKRSWLFGQKLFLVPQPHPQKTRQITAKKKIHGTLRLNAGRFRVFVLNVIFIITAHTQLSIAFFAFSTALQSTRRHREIIR
jgi:hypothetical protein